MADHHHHHGGRQGKAPIYSSQAPGHGMVPKGSYSSCYPGTTAKSPTTKMVQTTSFKDYNRLEESKHKHLEHSVAVLASAVSAKHQIKKPQSEKHHQIEKHVIEKHVIERHVIEKHVIEKHRIEKHRVESDPKHSHRHKNKVEVAAAAGAYVMCERHEKKAHKLKEVTSVKKHGHHLS